MRVRTVLDASEMHAPMYPAGGVSAFQGERGPDPGTCGVGTCTTTPFCSTEPPFVGGGAARRKANLPLCGGDRRTTGGLSLSAVRSRDYTHRFVVEPTLLRREFRRLNTEAWVASVELIRQRVRRTPCSRLMPRGWDLDTWAYRTEDDRLYVANLRRILDNLRLREEEPSEALLAWEGAILPDGFTHTPERLRDPPMLGKLKFERRMRNRMGVFVVYEGVEVTTFKRSVLNTRYPEIPRGLPSVKSLRTS